MSATGHISRHERDRGPVVLIGSLGGLEAVCTVLGDLPETFTRPIVVLLHRLRRSRPDMLAPLLQRYTTLPVRLATPDMCLTGPGVTVIPRGKTATFSTGYRLVLEDTDRVGGGDVLLSSAATVGGRDVLGVVLTGMLRDGARGVREVKRHGGRVLVEDPDTARASGMPSAAIATGCIDFVLPLRRIAAGIIALTMAPGAADLLAVPTPPWASLQQA